MSGISGSLAFGSHRRAQIDSSIEKSQESLRKQPKPLAKVPLEMVSAGDHALRSVSRHIAPLALIFGWYMRVAKATLGGLKG